MSGYGEFAAFYDALTENVDYHAWAAYLLEVFTRHGERPALLLDLACGSGSMALELASQGVDVIGVDGSEEMLAEAQRKSAEAGLQLLFLCQDMRELDLYGTVDGAICTLDSLNHVTETADLREILRRLGLFIAPGGLFVFDANTPHKHRETLGDQAFVLEEDGVFCVWRNSFSPARCETVMQLDFFTGNGETYQRSTDVVRERGYAMSTWKKLLAEAGFELLAVYAEQSFAPPEADADRWVFVTRNLAIGQKNVK